MVDYLMIIYYDVDNDVDYLIMLIMPLYDHDGDYLMLIISLSSQPYCQPIISICMFTVVM